MGAAAVSPATTGSVAGDAGALSSRTSKAAASGASARRATSGEGVAKAVDTRDRARRGVKDRKRIVIEEKPAGSRKSSSISQVVV